jgi:hypothetical protein
MQVVTYVLPPNKTAILEARERERALRQKQQDKNPKAPVTGKPFSQIFLRGKSLRPARGICAGDVDTSYRFSWHVVRSQALILQILFLATLCLQNYSFGLLVTIAIVPLFLISFARRSIICRVTSFLGLIVFFSGSSMALVFPDASIGGAPGGGLGYCLKVLSSLVLLPPILLLAVELGEGLDAYDRKLHEEWEFE